MPLPSPDTRPSGAGATSEDPVAEFLAAHSGHEVAHLSQIDAIRIVASGPLWDPMTTLSVQVTDGLTFFVLITERRSIEEPRRCRFFPGKIAPLRPLINIDTRDLRRGLDLEFYPHLLRRSLVDRFIEVFVDLIHSLDPDELEIAFDDANDPTVSIARLPTHVHEALQARSAEIFPPEDLVRVRKFLDENRFEDGLLALRVHREAQLESAELR
ncbi:MAG: hypothetical protein HY270_18570 [Deltaproteobacteria bacterium]|nr:hypothetical protein [Deltaproteobacteria bacterium]